MSICIAHLGDIYFVTLKKDCDNIRCKKNVIVCFDISYCLEIIVITDILITPFYLFVYLFVCACVCFPVSEENI